MKPFLLAFAAIAIATSAQAQQWPTPQAQKVPTSRTGVIPPIEYDYPYKGDLILQRGDKEKMEKECPIQTPMTMACAFRRVGVPDGQPSDYCRIVIANDEIFEERIRTRGFWSYDTVLRHEIGHCNGWPGDHKGGRSLAEAEEHERAQQRAQEEERIRKRDAQSTALYSNYVETREAWWGWERWRRWRHDRAVTPPLNPAH